MTGTWRCTYKGRLDPHSTGGHAAASWRSFDYREWTHTSLKRRIRLVNLCNEGHPPVPERGTLYRVLVYDHLGDVIGRRGGTCWTTLVREAKQDFGSPG